MNDLISRKAAIEALSCCQTYLFDPRDYDKKISLEDAEYAIEQLPSAQSEIIRCKYCKHWKDIDGVYRRGFDAESRCPLNIKEVYEGTFYCGFGERKEEQDG